MIRLWKPFNKKRHFRSFDLRAAIFVGNLVDELDVCQTT
jgi:hypothetical protein